jgi:SAM-dependent methyltransferase
MRPQIAKQLVELNRQFYQTFGVAFSATRGRIQPGVRKILNALEKTERILDLGCGNGEFARELARSGFRGEYLGLDFSLPLLRDAESQPDGVRASFQQADLTNPADWSLDADHWTLVTCFATLHHIPGEEMRLGLLRQARALLAPQGRFILSNWQFLNSPRLRGRIQPWERVGLSAAQVDDGDYLIDWRSGGQGLRYAHHFSAEELSVLAAKTGFGVAGSFFSDGAEGNLGLYQIWEAR